jgi:hypothetical protein
VCEDVRSEAGDKLSVLGLFAGNLINVPSDAPDLNQIMLALVFMLSDGEGTLAGTFQLHGPGGIVGSVVQVPPQTKVKENTAVLVFGFKPTPPIPLGEFRADLTLSGSTYSHVFHVRRAPVPH